MQIPFVINGIYGNKCSPIATCNKDVIKDVVNGSKWWKGKCNKW